MCPRYCVLAASSRKRTSRSILPFLAKVKYGIASKFIISTFLFHRWPGLFHSSTAVKAPSHRSGQSFPFFTALVGAIMSKPQEAPYGTWKSPLPADAFAAGAVSLEEVVVNVSADRFRLQGTVQLIENDSNRTARSTSLS
jgi:hypothetical protein